MYLALRLAINHMPHSYLIELYHYGLSISFSDADTVSTLGYSNCGKKSYAILQTVEQMHTNPLRASILVCSRIQWL